MEENPRYKVNSRNISGYIQFMKYHAVIGKFMGMLGKITMETQRIGIFATKFQRFFS